VGWDVEIKLTGEAFWRG